MLKHGEDESFEDVEDALFEDVEAEQFFDCPYCWQRISVLIEPEVAAQTYVEDCEVCCNPIQIRYRVGPRGRVSLEAERAQ